MDHIASLPEKEQGDWLVLSEHPDFRGCWKVDSLNQGFYFDFEEIVGRYRTVSPAKLSKFLDHANDLQYHVCFEDDPFAILEAFEHLNEPPPFSLNSEMENVVPGTGMLPFQVQGFNKLKDSDLKGGNALWSTGTGKTALEAALIKWHGEVRDEFDLAVVCVKSNNKVDTQRKLTRLGDIESFIIEGTKEKRLLLYELARDALLEGNRLVLITNYEKWREDEDEWKELIENRRVLIFWDEMPAKIRNRNTQLHDAIGRCLYKSWKKVLWHRKRPSWLRQYELTATPISNSPIDHLNCTRLIDPEVFPTVKGWEKMFVATRDFFSKEPDSFKNLEKMGLMIEFMTHQVDRDDPDIAKMFPEVSEDTIAVDWDSGVRAAYDQLQKIAADLILKAKEDPSVKKLNVLSLIQVLQMLCDAPSMVQKSAENREAFEALLSSSIEEDDLPTGESGPRGSEAALALLNKRRSPLTDDDHTKFEALKELLLVKHPNEKFLVYFTWNNYFFPAIEAKLKEWGVTYVTYRGTDTNRLSAKDAFRTDPRIRVFLSSDSGSDSIDLPEARVGVNYNLPWTWVVKRQRRGRNDRVDSEHTHTFWYDLRMPDSVEDRKAEIIDRKRGYHEAIFKGEISDAALSARITHEDLMYILTGQLD